MKGQKKKDEFKLTLKHLEIENLKKILKDLKNKKKNLELIKIKECNELENDKEEILRLIKKSLNHLKNNIKYEKRITENLKNHIVNILDGRTKYEIIFVEEIQNYINEKISYNKNERNSFKINKNDKNFSVNEKIIDKKNEKNFNNEIGKNLVKKSKVNFLENLNEKNKEELKEDNFEIGCNDKNFVFGPNDLEVICDSIIERISENKESNNFANWREIIVEDEVKDLIRQTFVS